MRCFCELTNQSTALTPRDRLRKCGKVLQREKRKAQQVIVCHMALQTNEVCFLNLLVQFRKKKKVFFIVSYDYKFTFFYHGMFRIVQSDPNMTELKVQCAFESFFYSIKHSFIDTSLNFYQKCK